MKISFINYLWALLPRPYKVFGGSSESREPPEIKKWVGSIGHEMDETREMLFLLRRLWSIPLTPGSLLDTIGYDRNMPRWDDEPDDEYRARLLAAFELYQMGGTVPGLIKVLSLLGFDDVEITERITPEQWAEFAVDLKVTNGLLTEGRFSRIRRAINDVKAAHTILARLTAKIEQEEHLNLYHGIATFRRKHIKLWPEGPELPEQRIYHGAATGRFGRCVLYPERAMGGSLALYAGILITTAKYVFVGMEEEEMNEQILAALRRLDERLAEIERILEEGLKWQSSED